EQHVVWPLDGRREARQQVVNRFRQRQRGEAGKAPRPGALRLFAEHNGQQQRGPRRGEPAPSLPTAPGSLIVSHVHGTVRCAAPRLNTARRGGKSYKPKCTLLIQTAEGKSGATRGCRYFR